MVINILTASVVSRSCSFNLKCVNNFKNTTLTVGKTYCIVELGLNGYFKVCNDNGRYCWYHPSNFNYKKSPEYILRLIRGTGLCGCGIK